MRNIENKKSIFFILILAVVLCVLLAVGIFKDNMMAKENAADYNKWYQAKKENRHIPQYKLDLLRELKNKMEIGNSEYLESDINYKRLKYLFDEQ